MEWLQRIYIFFLNPFCGLSEKIDPRVKTKLIYIVCFMLYATCYVWYIVIGVGTPLTLLSRMIQSIVLIIVLVFLGLEKPLKPVKWNRLVICIWFALGALIFIFGFFNEQNTGYWMTGPVIAVGLPCFYMVYGKCEKYEMIFDAICKAAMICTILYFAMCLCGEFFSNDVWEQGGRYKGLTDDANKIAELCLSSFCCGIYYLVAGKESVWKKINIISIAIVLAQVYLTQSRTAILAVLLILIAYVICISKKIIVEQNRSKKHLLRQLICMAIVIVIAISCVYAIKATHQYASSVNNGNNISSIELKVNTPQNRNLISSETTDLNDYSSGRLEIWAAYVEEFSLFGKPADAQNPISSNIDVRTAHNSFIEITYRSGYITGGVYLILEFITIIFSLIVVFKKCEEEEISNYFFVFSAIGYIVFTNLMPSYNPLTAIIFLLYTISMPAMLNNSAIKRING